MLREGTTTAAFRVKALLLFLDAQRDPSAVRAFADQIGGRSLVDNETRLLTRQLWVRAVRDFVKVDGNDPGCLRELAPYLVHPENLGAWSRVLRGAADSDAVFRQLGDANDGLPGDVFWVTEQVGPRRFRCQAFIGDAAGEERSLLADALGAELAAIPLLFGQPLGRVVDRGDDGDVRVFTVEWRHSGPRAFVGALVGAVLLAALSLAARAFGWAWLDSPTSTWLPLSLGPSLLITALGVLLWREAERMSVSEMQRNRIGALEREALLNRKRSMEISRPHEEPVIAGQYRVGRQLGVGASGAVWEATRLTDGVQVALKLLRTAVVHDVRATDRLRREAEALGLSWHPNVVEVLDTGILSSGVGFLVMERLRGETLAERLHARKRLSSEETRQLALSAADALFAVHSAGVIHRDIKPANLFLALDDEGNEELKLIDFGVARISWAETRLTRSGVRIGTPGYASPEQENGNEVDGRTDIYGLGISLYECLTGIAPGPPPSSPTSPSNVVVPAPWLEVLARMTATDPAERYGSARELRDVFTLLPAFESSPVPAVAPSGQDVA